MIVLALVNGSNQSALAPAGEYASHIGRLWNVFLAVSVVVYVLVLIALGLALFRRGRVAVAETPRGAVMAVSIAIGVTVLTLFGLLTASIFTSRSLASVSGGPMLQIKIKGHQWWWAVEYEEQQPSNRITTANEITIPVGVPVNLLLESPDVIHSLWIPNLHGKRDLIPGKKTSFVIKADRAGVFRGQCAEFCGQQHAKMALWVNAVSRDQYAQWAEAQRKPSKIPSDPVLRKGQDVFMASPCPLCHTIAGTPASGKTAPDLTHFASRRSIAAGTLPNRRGYLAGWILDPQHIKPGSFMPPMALEKGDVEPLVAYLESLR
jgi:cytochrome c oxidase subunit II